MGKLGLVWVASVYEDEETLRSHGEGFTVGRTGSPPRYGRFAPLRTFQRLELRDFTAESIGRKL